jgi:hypothetical protein
VLEKKFEKDLFQGGGITFVGVGGDELVVGVGVNLLRGILAKSSVFLKL